MEQKYSKTSLITSMRLTAIARIRKPCSYHLGLLFQFFFRMRLWVACNPRCAVAFRKLHCAWAAAAECDFKLSVSVNFFWQPDAVSSWLLSRILWCEIWPYDACCLFNYCCGSCGAIVQLCATLTKCSFARVDCTLFSFWRAFSSVLSQCCKASIESSTFFLEMLAVASTHLYCRGWRGHKHRTPDSCHRANLAQIVWSFSVHSGSNLAQSRQSLTFWSRSAMTLYDSSLWY